MKTAARIDLAAFASKPVRALYGNIEAGASEYGLFVTLGTYTRSAETFARGKSNLRLIDGTGLIKLMLQYYEQFDSRYKGLILLKRVTSRRCLMKVRISAVV